MKALYLGCLGFAIPMVAMAAGQAPQGKRVFEYWCAPCHGVGTRYPGTVALQAKYGGKRPAVLEQRKDLTREMVRYYVRHGVSVMPFFRKTEISDAELDALAAYLAHNR